jgi:hypothetical protein
MKFTTGKEKSDIKRNDTEENEDFIRNMQKTYKRRPGKKEFLSFRRM